MRWLQTEYLLKGIFLGLLVYAALGQAAVPPAEGPGSLLRVNLPALGGLALALLVAGFLKRRQGYRARGRPVVFALFLLLESPTLVYLGIIGGTFAGTLLLPQPDAEGLLLPTVAGGAGLGLVFGLLRQVRQREARLGLILALAAGLVGMVDPDLYLPVPFLLGLIWTAVVSLVLTIRPERVFAGPSREHTALTAGAAPEVVHRDPD
jgi:hypothetical protein